jgi:hypothetical protein
MPISITRPPLGITEAGLECVGDGCQYQIQIKRLSEDFPPGIVRSSTIRRTSSVLVGAVV